MHSLDSNLSLWPPLLKLCTSLCGGRTMLNMILKYSHIKGRHAPRPHPYNDMTYTCQLYFLSNHREPLMKIISKSTLLCVCVFLSGVNYCQLHVLSSIIYSLACKAPCMFTKPNVCVHAYIWYSCIHTPTLTHGVSMALTSPKMARIVS